MDIQRIIASSLVVGMGAVLLLHIILLIIFDRVYIYEKSFTVLLLEAVMFCGIIALGISEFVKSVGKIGKE